jgi:23S rRNA (adenine2503-C2)-methyltransferase
MRVVRRLELASGPVFLIALSDGAFIEAADVSRVQGKGDERVLSISTMAGCPVGCRFCAASRTYQRRLLSREMLGQVELLLDGAKDERPLRVLFTRMGEPMLNADSVLIAQRLMLRRHPAATLVLSTSGFKRGLDQLLDARELLPRVELQFSLHSTSDQERSALFRGKMGKSMMSLPQLGEAARRFHRLTGRRVGLNLILFEGHAYEPRALLEAFGREAVELRLSRFNEVAAAGLAGVSARREAELVEQFEAAGLSYRFVPVAAEELLHKVACGQPLLGFEEVRLAKPLLDRARAERREARRQAERRC